MSLTSFNRSLKCKHFKCTRLFRKIAKICGNSECNDSTFKSFASVNIKHVFIYKVRKLQFLQNEKIEILELHSNICELIDCGLSPTAAVIRSTTHTV